MTRRAVALDVVLLAENVGPARSGSGVLGRGPRAGRGERRETAMSTTDDATTAMALARTAAAAAAGFKAKAPTTADTTSLASIALSLARIADALEARTP